MFNYEMLEMLDT